MSSITNLVKMILLVQMRRTTSPNVLRCQEPILKLRNNCPDIQRQTPFLLMTEEYLIPSSRNIQTLGVRSLLRLNYISLCLKL